MKTEALRIALIKPSRYDDEGYVVQWWRSLMPSNALAVVYSIVMDCNERKLLGPDVEIEVRAFDETNVVLPMKELQDWVLAGAAGSFVGLVGVQSNQFPRAMDLARPLRKAGVDVVVGGFHVSGCLAMLPELPADLREAQDLGIILYAGECEERLQDLLRDLRAGTAKPIYNYMDSLPGLEGQPPPFLPNDKVNRTVGRYSSFDAGRGCPFQCSFCTIINVQGRKSRYRSANDIEAIVRANLEQGVRSFFVTDDNFARNKNWEAIFDRLIQLRRDEGLRIFMTLQVDTLCHRIPNFIDKAKAAGTTTVYIGLENINPANLTDAKKRQNRIWEYRDMIRQWKDHGIATYAGYILGFASDTPKRIEQDIRIIMDELPLDYLQFYPLTPLPGSEDHQRLLAQGVPMDPDMNNYDLEHVVVDHPLMSREDWTEIYWKAWQIYYTPEHMKRILKRRAATGKRNLRVMALMAFAGFPSIEGVHPIQGGIGRRKIRSQRRSGLPLVPAWWFYPARIVEASHATWRWISLYWWLRFTAWRINRDPNRLSYNDRSLSESAEEDQQMMERYGAAVAKRRPKPAAATS